MEYREEKLIALESRTLKEQCDYTQIEKETLFVIFGERKFHEYLDGRKFILTTDHMPMLATYGIQLLHDRVL